MVRGSGSVGCYQPVKPHTPMESAHKRSGIGGELVAFPCIRPMAVGLPCFRHPTNRLHTRLTTHANHAEGVQYATTSLSNGTTRRCKKANTASWSPIKRSSKLRAGLCLARPLWPGEPERWGSSHQRVLP